jgi:hypothetical protein
LIGYVPVNRGGDVMTGHLGLPAGPSASQAVRKDYVDTGLSAKQDSLGYTPVNKAGDTMTGKLTVDFTGIVDEALVLPDTPAGSATKALLRLGNAIIGGSANGTYIGLNAPSGYTGDFLMLQSNNSTKFYVDRNGQTIIDPGSLASALPLLVKQSSNNVPGPAIVIRAGQNTPVGDLLQVQRGDALNAFRILQNYGLEWGPDTDRRFRMLPSPVYGGGNKTWYFDDIGSAGSAIDFRWWTGTGPILTGSLENDTANGLSLLRIVSNAGSSGNASDQQYSSGLHFQDDNTSRWFRWALRPYATVATYGDNLCLWSNSSGWEPIVCYKRGGNTGWGTMNPLYGQHWFGGQTRLQALTNPTITSVTNQGAAGATTYSYYIVAVDRAGNKTAVSATVTTTTGNAVLDATNFNRITFTHITGAASYEIIRSAGGATQGRIGIPAAAVSGITVIFDDTGLVASAYTPPTRNATGDAIVDGKMIVGGSSRNAAAAFQVDSIDGGLLLPRMTLTEWTAVANVAGNLAYNSTSGRLSYNNGSTRLRVENAEGTATLTVTANAVTPDWDSNPACYLITNGANITVNNPTGTTPVDYRGMSFRIKNSSGGSITVTFGALYRGTDDVTLPLTIAASKTTLVHCRYNATDTKIDVVSEARNIA